MTFDIVAPALDFDSTGCERKPDFTDLLMLPGLILLPL